MWEPKVYGLGRKSSLTLGLNLKNAINLARYDSKRKRTSIFCGNIKIYIQKILQLFSYPFLNFYSLAAQL